MRSNRPLTRFACQEIKSAIQRTRPFDFDNTQGNTTVSCVVDGSRQQVAVKLFDSNILELEIHDFSVHAIKIQFGSTYASDGSPTKTTIERLNGLLELLGSMRALPEGVRVFRCPDSKACAIGRGTNYVIVGKNNCDGVMIKPSSTSFCIDGYTLNSGLIYWN